MKRQRREGQYQLIFVKWVDSYKVKKPWSSAAEIFEFVDNMDYIFSVGYLIRETNHYLILCNDIQFEDEKAISFGGIFSIPKGCVVARRGMKINAR